MGDTLTSGDLSEGQNDLMSYMLKGYMYIMYIKLYGCIVLHLFDYPLNTGKVLYFK